MGGGAQYVFSRAQEIVFTPIGNISSTNVQAALEELDAEKAAAIIAAPQFWPTIDGDYGAACDGNTATDGDITAGSATLNSASAAFTIGDEGKVIVVSGAGPSGEDLFTTIYKVTSTTQATLATTASSSVSGASFSWGTDDTTAIQTGLTELGTYGAGILYVPFKRVFTTGVLSFPANVSLGGKGHGPYTIGGGMHPGKTTIAPTIMVTNSSNYFMTCSGRNTTIQDLCFFYPNQVDGNSSSPKVYPYLLNAPLGVHFRNNFIPNCYRGINIPNGHLIIENNYWGSIEVAINIEIQGDVGRIFHNHRIPWWNIWSGTANGGPLDQWCLANGYGIKMKRVDQLEIDDFFSFIVNTGIYCTEDPSTRLGGYGIMKNIQLDVVKQGLYFKGGQKSGSTPCRWDIYGLHVVGADTTAVAVTCDSGGMNDPYVTIHGGNTWAEFATNKFVRNAGVLRVNDVGNYNPVGNISAPSIPSSDSAYTNNFTFKTRVNVYGGTVSAIKINGTATGLTSGSFVLDVGETITLTYSSTPSWTWFGL